MLQGFPLKFFAKGMTCVFYSLPAAPCSNMCCRELWQNGQQLLFTTVPAVLQLLLLGVMLKLLAVCSCCMEIWPDRVRTFIGEHSWCGGFIEEIFFRIIFSSSDCVCSKLGQKMTRAKESIYGWKAGLAHPSPIPSVGPLEALLAIVLRKNPIIRSRKN